MVILVTGGAGFIGSFIVDQLVDARHDVRVLDLLHPGAHGNRPDYVNPGAHYLWGDVADRDTARVAVAGIDAVCHQAAMVGLGVDFADAPAYVRHNDLGTATMLGELHAGGFTGRLVVASSMVVYGEGAYRCERHGSVRPLPRTRAALDARCWEPGCPQCSRPLQAIPVTEDCAPDPRNVYAATKLHQEHLSFAYGREHDSDVVALRYHNVYGPRMPRDTPYAGVASIFRSAIAAGRAPLVFEDGGQRRDFVHVTDVARANVKALTAPSPVGGIYNVASGESHTVLEMARAITAAHPGASLEPHVIPQYRLGDVRHVFGAADRARTGLGFEAQVSFATGMKEFATTPLRHDGPD